MIPDSLAGLLLFAASIGPGYVYIRVAERRRPRAERSQLLEAAELLVLGALITTVVAMLVVSVAQQVGLVDVATVHREGLDYLLLHPVRGFATLGAIFGLSYLGGGLVGWVAHLGEQASQQPGTVWRDVFGQKKETNDAWATVELRDGRFLQGQVVSYTLDVSSDPRELALAAPLYQRRVGRTDVEQVSNTDFLVLREEDVLYVAVNYQAKPVPLKREKKRRFRLRRSRRTS